MVPVGQHFTEEVRRELVQRFGAEQTMGGLVVRTSLEPDLQAAAEKALREGLVNYDRRRGGWRGALGTIPAGATEWMPALEAFQRPAVVSPTGSSPWCWTCASMRGSAGSSAAMAGAAPQARTGLMYSQDMSWARAAWDGRTNGGAPGRMNQVVNVAIAVSSNRCRPRCLRRAAPRP